MLHHYIISLFLLSPSQKRAGVMEIGFIPVNTYKMVKQQGNQEQQPQQEQPQQEQRQDQEQHQGSLLYEDQDVFEDLDLFLSSLINTPVPVPDVHPSHPTASYPPSAAKEEEKNNSSTSVSTCKRYLPKTEPITPTKNSKKGHNVKNPKFKKHRSFPIPSLPPYYGN